MHAKIHRRPGHELHYYRCTTDGFTRPRSPCGVGMIPREALEAEVETAIRTRFVDEAFVRDLLSKEREAPDDGDDTRAAALRDELDRARLAYQRGLYTLDEFADAKGKIDHELATLRDAPDDGHQVDVGTLLEAAATLPIAEFLRAARVIVIATKERVRLEFLP